MGVDTSPDGAGRGTLVFPGEVFRSPELVSVLDTAKWVSGFDGLELASPTGEDLGVVRIDRDVAVGAEPDPHLVLGYRLEAPASSSAEVRTGAVRVLPGEEQDTVVLESPADVDPSAPVVLAVVEGLARDAQRAGIMVVLDPIHSPRDTDRIVRLAEELRSCTWLGDHRPGDVLPLLVDAVELGSVLSDRQLLEVVRDVISDAPQSGPDVDATLLGRLMRAVAEAEIG